MLPSSREYISLLLWNTTGHFCLRTILIQAQCLKLCTSQVTNSGWQPIYKRVYSILPFFFASVLLLCQFLFWKRYQTLHFVCQVNCTFLSFDLCDYQMLSQIGSCFFWIIKCLQGKKIGPNPLVIDFSQVLAW